MSDLGKAIYMACSVFLFIIAASTSIYLYGTLNKYLEISTSNINISNRAEETIIDGTKKARDITSAEIYIMLYNMEQMHVDSVTVSDKGTFSQEQILNKDTGVATLLDYLERNPNKKFTCSYTYSSSTDAFSVTYK